MALSRVTLTRAGLGLGKSSAIAVGLALALLPGIAAGTALAQEAEEPSSPEQELVVEQSVLADAVLDEAAASTPETADDQSSIEAPEAVLAEDESLTADTELAENGAADTQTPDLTVPGVTVEHDGNAAALELESGTDLQPTDEVDASIVIDPVPEGADGQSEDAAVEKGADETSVDDANPADLDVIQVDVNAALDAAESNADAAAVAAGADQELFVVADGLASSPDELAASTPAALVTTQAKPVGAKKPTAAAISSSVKSDKKAASASKNKVAKNSGAKSKSAKSKPAKSKANVAATAASLTGVPVVTNGQEKQVGGNWRYYYADGTMARDTLLTLDFKYLVGGIKTVYYDADGNMRHDEAKVRGSWRYFDPSTGAMAQNKFVRLNGAYLVGGPKTVYYDDAGKMVYGEAQVGGDWYNFDVSSGAMSTGLTNLDYGYLVDGPKTVYYDNSGKMQYGEKKVGNNWHYFDPSTGAMAKNKYVYLNGSYLVGGAKTVYYDKSGIMVHGEKQLSGAWHFFDPSTGAMAQNKFVTLTGSYLENGPKTVYYDAGGEMVYGLAKVHGNYYYLQLDSGALLKGRKLHFVSGNRVVSLNAGHDGKLAGGAEAFDAIKRGTNMRGIDIASYEGGINLAATKAQFVIAKSSEGTSYKNPYFEDFAAQAGRAGIMLGIYHYASGEDPTHEAKWFVDSCGTHLKGAALFLDYEEPAVMRKGPMWAEQFIGEVKRLTGKQVGVYTSASVVQDQDWSRVAKTSKLWCAGYPESYSEMGYQSTPRISNGDFGAWSKPTIYQYTSSGKVPGFDRHVDLNILLGDKSTWKSMI